MVVINEFSDEWWRSDLAAVGFDVEGCPNSNAYAHTSCGIVTVDGILNLEYMGVYRLRDIPLGYCVIPKEAAQVIATAWSGSNIYAGKPVCTGLTSIVPWYVYPILAGCSFFVFVLLLVLPTPNPPKISDRQLQYFADDDLDRHFGGASASNVQGASSRNEDSKPLPSTAQIPVPYSATSSKIVPTSPKRIMGSPKKVRNSYKNTPKDDGPLFVEEKNQSNGVGVLPVLLEEQEQKKTGEAPVKLLSESKSNKKKVTVKPQDKRTSVEQKKLEEGETPGEKPVILKVPSAIEPEKVSDGVGNPVDGEKK